MEKRKLISAFLMRTADNLSVFLTEDMIGSEALGTRLEKHLPVERDYIETRVELLRQYRSQYSDPGVVCIICSSRALPLMRVLVRQDGKVWGLMVGRQCHIVPRSWCA
jgi:hypothetical protein